MSSSLAIWKILMIYRKHLQWRDFLLKKNSNANFPLCTLINFLKQLFYRTLVRDCLHHSTGEKLLKYGQLGVVIIKAHMWQAKIIGLPRNCENLCFCFDLLFECFYRTNKIFRDCYLIDKFSSYVFVAMT